jgi:hypothetical protein
MAHFSEHKLEGRDHLEDLRIDERTILKCIIKKLTARLWTGFVWIWIGSRGRSNVVGIATRLRAALFGVQVLVGGRDIYFLQNVKTGSYSVGTGTLTRGHIGQGVKLNTHIHLVPRLRMSGAVPLLPLHAFITWTSKTFLSGGGTW